MKMLASAVTSIALLASLPALAQNQTGTGSGMPHQPGDRERALALRNGQVTLEQLGASAYSPPWQSPPLQAPPAAIVVAPNPALNSGGGNNACLTVDARGNCQDSSIGR